MGKQETKTQLDPMPLELRKKRKTRRAVVILAIVVTLGIVIINKDSIYDGLVKITKNIPGLENTFGEDTGIYTDSTKEELISNIQVLEAEIENLKNQIEVNNEEKVTLLDKISSLEVYEESYTEFSEQKKAWDTNIAESNTELFIQQFESIYPEDAAQIYRDLKQKQVVTKEQKDYSKMIAEMDEERAARALETVTQSDPELVQTIFAGMERERQALILSAMNTEVAAQIIKILSPDIEINIP